MKRWKGGIGVATALVALLLLVVPPVLSRGSHQPRGRAAAEARPPAAVPLPVPAIGAVLLMAALAAALAVAQVRTARRQARAGIQE